MPTRTQIRARWMPDQITKREAAYHPASHYCGACVFLIETRSTGFECERVKGKVEYDAGCKLFKPVD